MKIVASVIACLLSALVPARALACGGCFPGPTGSPTAVDAHRMVMVVSPSASTLWDQIVYAGDPSDFVWVLPVASGARVVLADNGFFEALTQETQILMQAPPPPPARCPDPCLGLGFIASEASADFMPRPSPVRVEFQGVVGPYETATIESDDPRALLTWLNENGYRVDDALLPIIDHYVGLRMSFAVLRLRPGEGVDRMQPVRVTTPGLSTTLPLRMVAAGVAVDLSLELFVFAESRMEPTNFGNAEVDRAAITYDWRTSSFDYEARFEDAIFAGDGPGRNWVTEYAAPVVDVSSLESFTSRAPDGTEHRARNDVGVVRTALRGDLYLTRLRTRLALTDLREDLNLRVSTGADVGTFILVTREANRPAGPACSGVCANASGLEPGVGVTRGTGSAYRCGAVSHRAPVSPVPLLVIALACVRRARSRR